MPYYRTLCLVKPATSKKALTTMFRDVARLVYRERGNFRTIENLGVRPLATPVARNGMRFGDARWVSCSFDANPKGRSEVEKLLNMSSDILGLEIARPDFEEELSKYVVLSCTCASLIAGRLC